MSTHICVLSVLQLALCGQDPETALNSALASVNFYLQQQQLYFEFREAQLQKKISKVQEACKKKLQEVHTGYTAVSTITHHPCPVSLLQQPFTRKFKCCCCNYGNQFHCCFITIVVARDILVDLVKRAVPKYRCLSITSMQLAVQTCYAAEQLCQHFL